MYLDYKVNIPDKKGITRKTIKGTTYVYYAYDRKYDPKKKHTVPINTTIGKCESDESDRMYPNTNFLKYFPDVDMPLEKETEVYRSSCLRIGSYLVLRRIAAEYRLEEMLSRIIGKDSGLFLDLAIYTIITENNAGQYYPEYAFNHPLFTSGMRIYSDSKVSDFLNSLTVEQSIAFQNEWNANHDHREKIYISYDSTNKKCQAGDIDLVENGYFKEEIKAPVINYAIAYDTNNAVPLFYEDYPGSIVDISQLQAMLEKANGYGYRHAGFILDRGYFSKENIHYMDKCGYDFVIMMKGMRELVKDLVLQVKGTFEEDRSCSIREYKVSGTTVKKQLYPSDRKKRYFHIYYNSRKTSSERESLEAKIDHLSDCLRKYEGTGNRPPEGFRKYFDLIYHHEGQEDEKFMYGRELTEVINEEIKLCGYFVIITSEEMTAAEALELYKSRDASEKLFRGDKSYLGNRSFRTHTNESTQAKIFVEFVALILRNRFHTCIRKQKLSSGKKSNYMNVPAAIRELEKIEMIRQYDGQYRLAYAVTATQKEILKAFGMTAAVIKEQAIGIGEDLQRRAKREEEKWQGKE